MSHPPSHFWGPPALLCFGVGVGVMGTSPRCPHVPPPCPRVPSWHLGDVSAPLSPGCPWCCLGVTSLLPALLGAASASPSILPPQKVSPPPRCPSVTSMSPPCHTGSLFLLAVPVSPRCHLGLTTSRRHLHLSGWFRRALVSPCHLGVSTPPLCHLDVTIPGDTSLSPQCLHATVTTLCHVDVSIPR